MAQQPLSEASDTDTEMRHYSFDQESDSGDHDESAGEDRRTSVQKATWDIFGSKISLLLEQWKD